MNDTKLIKLKGFLPEYKPSHYLILEATTDEIETVLSALHTHLGRDWKRDGLRFSCKRDPFRPAASFEFVPERGSLCIREIYQSISGRFGLGAGLPMDDLPRNFVLASLHDGLTKLQKPFVILFYTPGEYLRIEGTKQLWPSSSPDRFAWLRKQQESGI